MSLAFRVGVAGLIVHVIAEQLTWHVAKCGMPGFFFLPCAVMLGGVLRILRVRYLAVLLCASNRCLSWPFPMCANTTASGPCFENISVDAMPRRKGPIKKKNLKPKPAQT